MPSLQTALEIQLCQMKQRNRTVFPLKKLLSYLLDLGRHEHNQRPRESHEPPIPRLIGIIGRLTPLTVDTMLTPDQTAALNRVAVQNKVLRDKTQILEFQLAGPPEELNRTIEALTRPNPLQRT